MNKGKGVENSIEYLLRHRLAMLPNHPTGYEWVTNDPVVSFVAPILWHLHRKDDIFSPIDEQGRRSYWINAARFALFRDYLQVLIAELRKENIPIIVLKGPLLAEKLFDTPGYRTMNDLDVLVRHQDFQSALNCLAACGWQPKRSGDDAGLLKTIGRQDTNQAWQIGEWVFYDAHGHILDLHWHIVSDIWLRPAYKVNLDAIWQEAQPLHLPGFKGAFGLSDIHTLAHLCLHLAHHGLGSLRWLLDIDQFIRSSHMNPEWDWDAFVACATDWRMRSAAFHALSFSKHLFNTPVPARVLQQLNPGFASRARVAALIRPHHLLEHPSSSLGKRYPTLVKVALLDHITDMVHIIWRAFWPSPLWLSTRYQSQGSLINHWRHVIEVIARGD